MEMFLSCDWGTTSFRLRLVRVDDLHILAETTNGQGIAETYQRWINQVTPKQRLAFYASLLNERVTELTQQVQQSLAGVPIVLSGMASSSIGMKELPYQKLPVHIDGTDLRVDRLAADGANPLWVISGIQTDEDVMRGEETKLVGCSSLLADGDVTQLIILPGTHSKHVTVKQHKITAFNTYMTGEFFKLLSENSVLSASVEKMADADDEQNNQIRFSEGVRAAQTSGLLHAAFWVRTNQLLKNVSKVENFHYLSGLLIGSELKDIPADIPVYLAAGSVHHPLYKAALEELGRSVKGTMDADLALIAGQRQVLLKRA